MKSREFLSLNVSGLNLYCLYYRINYKLILFLLILNTCCHQSICVAVLKARIVLVRDLYQDSSPLLDSGQSLNYNNNNNSRFTNKKTIRKSVLEEILNDKPNSDAIIKLTDDIHRGIVTVRFDCISTYPAVWIYEGLGSPQSKSQVYAESRRSFENFESKETYRYFTTIYLRKLEEINTGKYSCQSLEDPQVQNFYYLFVQGPKFFVTDSGQRIGAELTQEKLVIPCAVTHPTEVKTALFKVDKMGHPERVNLTTFDPKVGFTVLYEDLPIPWGEYVCTAGNDSMTNSLIVNVDPPKKYLVKPTIASNYVQLNENIKQLFICEAKVNVTMKFSQNFINPPYHQILYKYDPEKEFPFVASFESDPQIFSNFSLITCVTQPDSNSSDDAQILHTWEYSTYGNDKNLTISFDEQLDAFLCCTIDSPVTPEMTPFFPCSSPQECHLRNFQSQLENYKTKTWLTSPSSWADERVKKAKLKKKLCRKKKDDFTIRDDSDSAKKERAKMFRIWNHYTESSNRIQVDLLPTGCSGLKRAKENHLGYFRCSVPNRENVQHTRDFFFSSNVKSKPVFSINDMANDELVSIQRSVTEENTSETRIRVGRDMAVFCKINSFFFSQGHVWAFERNGHIQIVPDYLVGDDVVMMIKDSDEDNEADNSTNFVPRRVETIKFPDKNISRLYCFVPLWNSSEWRNSSVSVHVV